MVRMVAQKAWYNADHEGSVDVGHSFEASESRAAELMRGGLALPALPAGETIPVSGLGNAPPPAPERRARRALLQFGIGQEFHKMLDLTDPLHNRFAEMWGVERVTAREVKPKGKLPRSLLWRKVELLIDTVPHFDQVLYLDADCVIVDPFEDLFALARRGIAMCECWNSPSEPVHLQAGVLLLNRSPDVLTLLEEWNKMPTGMPYDDQGALIAMMKETRWRDLLTIIPNRYNCVAGHMDSADPVIRSFHGDAQRLVHMQEAINAKQ